MRGFTAVLRRELVERRLVLAAAALLGLMPLAAPVLPGGSAALRGDTALALSGLVSIILALFLGSSVVTRDLAERRFSFYFARPISGAAIWAGKIGAAALLVFGAGLTVLLPTALFARLQAGSFRPDFLPVAGALLLLLLLGAHAAGIALRSRSAWLLLDFLSLCAVLALAGFGWMTLRLEGALDTVDGWPKTLFALLQIAILATAGAVQVIRGRTDLRRSHRILSLTLWPLLLAGAAAFLGYSQWVVGANLADVTRVQSAFAAPAGDWAVVSGPAAHRRGYTPSFLVDTSTGRSLRLPALAGFSFSADGRRAAWGESALNGRSYGVLSLDLTRPGASPVREPASPDGYAQLALSPDGRRLAGLTSRLLTADDLEADRLVASVRLEGSTARAEMRFPDPDHLRLFRIQIIPGDEPGSYPCLLEIGDLDLGTGAYASIEALEGTELYSTFRSDPAGRRFVARESDDSPLRLYDGRTGRAMADLAPGRGASAHFLADGRLALALRTAAGMELRILEPDGTGEPRKFPFPGATTLRIGGQPRRGLLAVGEGTAGAARTWRSTLLDLDSGARWDLGEGRLPVPAVGQSSGPESVGSRLFFRSGALVRLDPETGRERRIAGHSEGERQ